MRPHLGLRVSPVLAAMVHLALAGLFSCWVLVSSAPWRALAANIRARRTSVPSVFFPEQHPSEEPGMARHEAARKAVKKAKARAAGKAPIVDAAKAGAPVPAAAVDKGRGKDKGRAVAGPSTPAKGTKKRAAEDSPGEKDKTGKRKKKKVKEIPEPPIRVPCSTPFCTRLLSIGP
ncbi:hypothetical protein PENPOL_c004G08040 [Penicillium polonicum]|uniref:Uncharacterized protein n=1 Tax=Penicillium polonicum TaxID=60169 RepID=A0A1V6NNU3_PENPO|nr:hypothetical protein PENPOL_c004G08040 [Penicillium polonicum]